MDSTVFVRLLQLERPFRLENRHSHGSVSQSTGDDTQGRSQGIAPVSEGTIAKGRVAALLAALRFGEAPPLLTAKAESMDEARPGKLASKGTQVSLLKRWLRLC